MSDEKTLNVYAERAAEYGAKFSTEDIPKHLRNFMSLLPKNATVLDLGCGHGSSSHHLATAGFTVDAWDASPEMLALIKPHANITTKCVRFDHLTEQNVYDGIWCNFALLHAPRAEMPNHLTAISDALRKDGILHLGLKTGTGSKRDTLGRFYTYYTVSELHDLLKSVGLTPISSFEGEEPGLAGPVEPFVIIKSRKETQNA